MQSYKETCKDIVYDCTTDLLTATCGNNVADSIFNTSSLANASECVYLTPSYTIANIWGFLQCQTLPISAEEEPPASGEEAPAPEVTYFSHTLDFDLIRTS